MGEALSQFVEEAQHLSSQFDSTTVFSIAGWNVSQYVLYMLVALVLVAALVLIAGRKLTLVPHGKFAHIFEFGYNFISEGVGADVIGEGFKKHVPFLATLFFFILTANIIGLIPGAKAAMGTISITWALAAISFIYFNFWGLKELGFFHYFKSLCPSGVPAPIAPIIWFLEFFSMVIRVLTLAVRLYGNMFAGHMILGIFAIMTQFFIPPSSCRPPSSRWTSLRVCLQSHGSSCCSSCMRSKPSLLSCRHTYSPFCLLPTSAWQSILTDRKKQFSACALSGAGGLEAAT